jgi:hypothetical protein
LTRIKARGAELGRLLEKELGPVDPDRLKEVEGKPLREYGKRIAEEQSKLSPTKKPEKEDP